MNFYTHHQTIAGIFVSSQFSERSFREAIKHVQPDQNQILSPLCVSLSAAHMVVLQAPIQYYKVWKLIWFLIPVFFGLFKDKGEVMDA